MRLIDADALKEKMKCTNRYFNIKFDIDEAPTIDPEMLPIVQELREQLAQVTAERDALKSNLPVEIESDAFELATRLARVTVERDAAIDEIPKVCYYCKKRKGWKICKDFNRNECEGSCTKWEWRGLQEAKDNE